MQLPLTRLLLPPLLLIDKIRQFQPINKTVIAASRRPLEYRQPPGPRTLLIRSMLNNDDFARSCEVDGSLLAGGGDVMGDFRAGVFGDGAGLSIGVFVLLGLDCDDLLVGGWLGWGLLGAGGGLGWGFDSDRGIV
jgi:hypothetical protein